MKHLSKVSVERRLSWAQGGSRPDLAVDAKTDYLNAIWKATTDYVVAKKNEISL
jgi:hypothetical protein